MHTNTSKTAIVTGGTRGIGQEISKRLAADGFAVVVNYAGNSTKARETVAAIESAGGRAIAIQGDVGNPDDVAALFAGAKRAFGSVDVVVNSAGVMPLGPIASSTLAAFDKVVATNLRGAFLVLSEAAANVGVGGRIIALSTSVIAKSFPSYGPYIASKAGVEGLVRRARQRAAWPWHHGQRGRARACRHRPVPRGQEPGSDRPYRQAGPAGAAGHAGRHRPRGVVPGWP
jgi:3-oxoacyl-[acyl-carrier protein] reductase